jgi:hypothetical protein
MDKTGYGKNGKKEERRRDNESRLKRGRSTKGKERISAS